MEAGLTTASRSEIIINENIVGLICTYFRQLDFQLAADAGDTASFIPNGEWALMGELAKRINEMKNGICMWNNRLVILIQK